MPKQNEKSTKKIYNLTPREIINKFHTKLTGLDGEEAERRLLGFGLNKIEKKRRWKWLKLIFNQFNDALVWILLVAAVLAFYFHEARDVAIILIIVFINAAIGFFQEWKAEKILDSIRKLTNDRTIVIRDGVKREINTKNLVPGDVVYIASGDNIPADGYILESYDLRVNSYIFTGESKPKKKKAKIVYEKNLLLSDIQNMVYMGETVATGEARFAVTATGMETELGKIAHLTQEVKDEATPMQKQMRALGKDVTILAVLIGIIVVVAGQYFKMSLYQNFLFALALAVSVVPEGLPAAISVALSLGMKRLLKDNVLAKKLNAVETLGSVSIVCTDKTGTITKNELTVTRVVLGEKIIEITGAGYEPEGNFLDNGRIIDQSKIKNLDLVFKTGVLCNDANLVKDRDGRWKIIGDPTEGSLVVAARKYDIKEKYLEAGEIKITENPFSLERMKMSVVYRDKEKKAVSYVKGSPDVIIDLCGSISIEGRIGPFSAAQKEKIKAIYNSMSLESLRVLAFAYRDLKKIRPEEYHAESEKNLVWLGMMAMIDPPREDVGKAILECKNLGINPIMITGDYSITAEAIARNIGLISNNSKGSTFGIPKVEPLAVIDGKMLNKLTDKDIYKSIKNGVCVFARIAPEQKLRIATILKNNNEIIAMTGDGVNDAPALKKADIGVAMGIMGSDVSKEASDMILMDDNFSSIVKGIKEGRTIFQNLKKFVHYVFTSNASELLTVIFGVILQIPSPISAIQILATDLGTDIFPSFALGLEPPEPEHKKNKKNKINSEEAIISIRGFRRIIYIGIIMATGAVIAFLWSMMRGGWHFGMKIDSSALLYIKSTTAAYAVISMTQMANLLQSRSKKLTPFQLGFFKNKYAIGAIFISVFMLLLFMYLPFCQKYLGTFPIDSKDWLVVAVTTLAVYFWEEIRKSEK
ncbi:MAG TPA: cation-transporting P-type ATPase [Candidatus Moranbacteria bacterium]|nr:cation-transporting P-type ATPase [Candidatus Moranbacteria bacterium]